MAKSDPPQSTRTEQFTTVMTPTAIDPPVVSTPTWPIANPLGSNTWPILDTVGGIPTVVGWIVTNRSVRGGVNGDLTGTGTFTYGGILDLLQAGSMQGILAINTGALDSLYLAASGTIATRVTENYTFPEIAAWCQGAGLPTGAVLSQIYNAPQLSLLPDGDLTFGQLQAWSAAIGLTTGQFLANVTGNPALAGAPDAYIQSIYGTPPLVLSGLQILGSMYRNALPVLPKTINADFSGTLRIDRGTGAYSGASGQGQFSPNNKQPLILHVSPIQHVQSVDGAIKLSGTYIKKHVNDRNVSKDSLRDSSEKGNNNHSN